MFAQLNPSTCNIPVVIYTYRYIHFFQDFREKNLDLVRPEIVATLKMSSMAFVRELMGMFTESLDVISLSASFCFYFTDDSLISCL